MGSLSTSEQRKLAYFHALSKSMTEAVQNAYESKYKSSHSVTLNDVWNSPIIYCSNYTAALDVAGSNYAVTYYDKKELDMIYGSNGQSYAYIQGGTFKDNTYPIEERGEVTTSGIFIRPWISPVDVPQDLTNEPSYGFELKLFKGNGTEIFQTEGAWTVDYYSGIVHFAEGSTPSDLGWGSVKASLFQYTGTFGVSILDDPKIAPENIGMSAKNTSSGSAQACLTGITATNIDGSAINVYINGVQVRVGEDCYFSNNGGLFRRDPGQEKIGDMLFWNYTGAIANAGYDLTTNDKISFIYLNK